MMTPVTPPAAQTKRRLAKITVTMNIHSMFFQIG
jgi:hypothetical protein